MIPQGKSGNGAETSSAQTPIRPVVKNRASSDIGNSRVPPFSHIRYGFHALRRHPYRAYVFLLERPAAQTRRTIPIYAQQRALETGEIGVGRV